MGGPLGEAESPCGGGAAGGPVRGAPPFRPAGKTCRPRDPREGHREVTRLTAAWCGVRVGSDRGAQIADVNASPSAGACSVSPLAQKRGVSALLAQGRLLQTGCAGALEGKGSLRGGVTRSRLRGGEAHVWVSLPGGGERVTDQEVTARAPAV